MNCMDRAMEQIDADWPDNRYLFAIHVFGWLGSTFTVTFIERIIAVFSTTVNS